MTTDPRTQIRSGDGSLPVEHDARLRQPADRLTEDADMERMHSESPAEGPDDTEPTEGSPA